MYVTTFRRKQSYRKRLFARSIIWSLIFRLWLSYLRLFLLCLDTYDFLCLSFPLFLSSTSVFVSVSLPLSSLVFFFFFYFCLYLVVRDSVAGRLNIKDTRIRNGQPLSNAMTKRRGEEYRGETGKSSGEPRNRRISIDPIYRRCYRRRWLVQIVRVFRNTDTIRRGTTRYDTTRHDTQRFTFTGCVVKTDSRGLFENCMLVPAERCSGVPLY